MNLSSALGFVLPALGIGFGAMGAKPQRGLYWPVDDTGEGLAILPQQVTFEESHHDEIVITEHPVERGARISDHMYKRQPEVTIKAGWSNSPPPSNSGGFGEGLLGAAVALGTNAIVSRLGIGAQSAISTISSILSGEAADQIKAIYEALIALQETGDIFDVFTGKRVYHDMLIRSLSVTTNEQTENSLVITIVCRQVLFAVTQVTSNTVNNEALASPENQEAVDAGSVYATELPSFDVPALAAFPNLSEIPMLNDAAGAFAGMSSLTDSLAGISAEVAANAQSLVGEAAAALGGRLPSLPGGLTQTLQTTLGGGQFNMRMLWNGAHESWMMDLADSVGNKLLSSVPLVAGANLLEQFEHLGIPGAFAAATVGLPNIAPTRENLGLTGKLIFGEAD